MRSMWQWRLSHRTQVIEVLPPLNTLNVIKIIRLFLVWILVVGYWPNECVCESVNTWQARDWQLWLAAFDLTKGRREARPKWIGIALVLYSVIMYCFGFDLFYCATLNDNNDERSMGGKLAPVTVRHAFVVLCLGGDDSDSVNRLNDLTNRPWHRRNEPWESWPGCVSMMLVTLNYICQHIMSKNKAVITSLMFFMPLQWSNWPKGWELDKWSHEVRSTV